MTAATYRFLDAVADSFNPLLAIVALALPFVRHPRALRSTIAYYLSAGAAIGVVYLIRAIDSRYQIWAAQGLDYSTHSAFAASLVTSMGAFRRRWLAPLVLAAVLYFSLELVMRYHGVLDILTSASPAVTTALLFHLALARVAQPRVAPSGSVG
jgi:uncharacterized membrane protein